MISSAERQYVTHAIRGEYCPHIDGIRALAVMPVVLFHILASICPGGFAGVDVFFVISGYLITSGILRDLEKNQFGLGAFYHRRIRRIMPAYFAMIAGVFLMGCVLYYATPLMLLGDSVVAGTLFVANFHFWMLGGDYFAPNLHSQALLHLWSLSVEEQFYLFIPLLCAGFFKSARRWMFPFFLLLTLFSLASSINEVLHGRQANAFYFLNFRAWELLSGSLLALATSTACNQKRCRNVSVDVSSFFAAIGFLLIMGTYFGVSSKTPFPGLAAVPPVLGTMLLIRYGGQSGYISNMLASRWFVSTGKISYSLYLWHWPITVFWKYAVYDQALFYDYVGMFLLSIFLGFLSWKYIEVPARCSVAWSPRWSYTFAAVGIIFLTLLGSATVLYKGWSSVLHVKTNGLVDPPPRDPFVLARAYAVLRHVDSRFSLGSKFIKEHERVRVARNAELMQGGSDGGDHIGISQNPSILVIGDSHAGSLKYGMDILLRENNLAGYVLSRSSSDMFNVKSGAAREVFELLEQYPNISQVIIVEMWLRALAANDGDGAFVYGQLEEFAKAIQSQNKQLFIATDIPVYKYALSDIEARTAIMPPRVQSFVDDCYQQGADEYKRQQGEINNELASVCSKTGALLIPLHEALRQGDGYVAFEGDRNDSTPLYRDKDHLSRVGSVRVARYAFQYLHSH